MSWGAPFLSAHLGVLSGCGGVVNRCWRAVCRWHGGDGIVCRFFSFLVSGGRGDGVSSRSSSRSSSRGGVLFRGGVPLLVLSFVPCGRPVRVSWVGVFVSGLASRFSFRVPSRVGVLCLIAYRRCPVAPFLSARVLVLSRLVSSTLLLFSCSFCRACRVVACLVAGRGGRGGEAVRVVDRAVGGSVMLCRVAWCVLRDERRDGWRDEGRGGRLGRCSLSFL